MDAAFLGDGISQEVDAHEHTGLQVVRCMSPYSIRHFIYIVNVKILLLCLRFWVCFFFFLIKCITFVGLR